MIYQWDWDSISDFIHNQNHYSVEAIKDRVDSIPLVYGRAKIKLTPIYRDIYGIFAVTVLPMCEGKISGVEQVYIDETAAMRSGQIIPDGVITHSNYNGMVSTGINQYEIEIKTGSKSQSKIKIFGDKFPKWGTTKRGDNIALLGVKYFSWFEKGKVVQFPEISVDVMGRMVSRLETNQSVGISFNAASFLYDLITNKRFGAGVPESMIDKESFIVAAKYIESKRLKANGVLDTSKSVKDLCKALLKAFHGDLYEYGGKIKLTFKRTATTPVMSFDESSIINKFDVVYPESRAKANVLIGKYVVGGVEQTATIPKEATKQMIEDGVIKPNNVDYNMVNDKRTASYLMNIDYNQMKQRRAIEFSAGYEAFELEIDSVIEVTESKNSLDKTLFIVDEIERSIIKNFGVCKIKATEYKASDYGSTGEIQDPEPKPTVNRYESPVPKNLKVVNKSVTGYSTVSLAWDDIEDLNAIEYVIEYKKPSDQNWQELGTIKQTPFHISRLSSGRYDFSVKTVNRFGIYSARAIITSVDLKDDRVYPKPDKVMISNNKSSETISKTKDWFISWDDVRAKSLPGYNDNSEGSTFGAYFDHYLVTIKHGNDVKRTAKVQTSDFIYPFTDAVKDGLSRNITFEIRFVSKSGATSQAAILAATNPQIIGLSGVDVSGGLSGLYVQFDMPDDVDFDGAEIHFSKDSKFKPSAATLAATLNNTNSYARAFAQKDKGQYFCKVGAFDCYGKDGIVWSATEPFSIADVNVFVPEINESDVIKMILGKTGEIDENAKLIAKEITDRTKAVKAGADKLAQEIINRASEKKGIEALITKETNARKAADTASMTATNKQFATINNNVAALQTTTKAITTKTDALSSKQTTLISDIGKNKSGLATEVKTRADQFKSISESITTLTSDFGTNKATFTKQFKAVTDSHQSLSKSVTNLESSIGSDKASLTKIAQVTDGMKTEYMIKAKSNGLIAGIGLMTDSKTQKSEVGIVANKFFIVNSESDMSKLDNKKIPFSVIDGQVIINDAVIKRIDASKITTGMLHSSAEITTGSGTKQAGMSGGSGVKFWAGNSVRDQAPYRVTEDGSFFATKATVTGKINATSGTFDNVVINESSVFKGIVYADKISGDVLKFYKSNGLSSFDYKRSVGNNPDVYTILENLVSKSETSKAITLTTNYLNVGKTPYARKIYGMDGLMVIVETPATYNPAIHYIRVTATLYPIDSGAGTTMSYVWENVPYIANLALKQAKRPSPSILPQGSNSRIVALMTNTSGSIKANKDGKYGLKMVVRAYDALNKTNPKLTGVRAYMMGGDEASLQFLIEKD